MPSTPCGVPQELRELLFNKIEWTSPAWRRWFSSTGQAPSTRKTYRAGINNFIQFCSKYDFSPVPTTQATLCSYVAYLADKKSTYQTITTYLAAVRYLQIINNVSPAHFSSMFTLQLVMKGAQRSIINNKKATFAHHTCNSA